MFALHHLRLLLLLVASTLAGALAWGLMRGAPPEPREASRPPTFDRATSQPTGDSLGAEREAILLRLAKAPEFADFTRRVSSVYPADWDRMLNAFARRGLAARTIESPESYVSDILRGLRRNRGIMASKASPALLARVFDAQQQLLSGLAGADKRLCVDFLLGQASPAFLDFAARNRLLLANMASATLDAMIDGDKARIDRDPPADADFDALETALTRQGLGKPVIGALLDGRLPDPPLPDATLCDAGLVYFDALKALPDDARMRLYALAVQAMSKS